MKRQGKFHYPYLKDGNEEISVFSAGIEETVAVDSTSNLGIALIVTGPSAKAVPTAEPVPDSVVSSSALLQTLRTMAKVQTNTSCHSRLIQASDMIDPLIEVYENPIFTKSRI